MAKKILTTIKMHVPAGKANPQTADKMGDIIPVELTVYADHSFTFITKTPPAASLLKKAAGIEKASGTPNREKIAQISREQVRKIAEQKREDLNARDIEAAIRIIAGTARSMGIEVVD